MYYNIHIEYKLIIKQYREETIFPTNLPFKQTFHTFTLSSLLINMDHKAI